MLEFVAIRLVVYFFLILAASCFLGLVVIIGNHLMPVAGCTQAGYIAFMGTAIFAGLTVFFQDANSTNASEKTIGCLFLGLSFVTTLSVCYFAYRIKSTLAPLHSRK